MAPHLRILAVPAARLGAAVAAGILAVSLVAGVIRVLPLLLAPGVPLGLAPTLGRGVLGVSLETALFVAPPVAWALAAARLVDRGEARALFALGVRPLRIIAGTWPSALAVVLMAGLAAASWGREAAAPGRLMRDLLEDAREACLTQRPPAAVDVPLLSVSWVCLPGEPARVVGTAASASFAFTAGAISLSDDLRELSAKDLTLLLPENGAGSARMELHATLASIQGLAPIGRASNLSAAARASLIATSTAAMAALAAVIVLAGTIRSRAIALAIGGAGPAAALMAFSSLERQPAPGPAYLVVPAAGLAAMALIGRILVRTGRQS